MKWHVKLYLSPTSVGQKHFKVELIAFNTNWNYNTFEFNYN